MGGGSHAGIGGNAAGGNAGGGNAGGGGSDNGAAVDNGGDDDDNDNDNEEKKPPPFRGRGPAGPTYEAAIASNNQEITIGKQGAPDLTDAQLSGPMRNGAFVGECGAPDSMKVTVQVAIKMGRPAGVSVSTRPPDPDVAGCIDRYVRTFSWPSSPKIGLVQDDVLTNRNPPRALERRAIQAGRVVNRCRQAHKARNATGAVSIVAFLLQLRGEDLNLRPSGYEPDELPGCSTARHVRLPELRAK